MNQGGASLICSIPRLRLRLPRVWATVIHLRNYSKPLGHCWRRESSSTIGVRCKEQWKWGAQASDNHWCAIVDCALLVCCIALPCFGGKRGFTHAECLQLVVENTDQHSNSAVMCQFGGVMWHKTALAHANANPSAPIMVIPLA